MNDDSSPPISIIESRLSEGERALWAGRPRQGVVFRSYDASPSRSVFSGHAFHLLDRRRTRQWGSRGSFRLALRLGRLLLVDWKVLSRLAATAKYGLWGNQSTRHHRVRCSQSYYQKPKSTDPHGRYSGR